MMSELTKEDFATEVRIDRLSILYKVTLGFCFIGFISVITFGFVRTFSTDASIGFAIALGVLVIGGLSTRFLLERERFTQGAWAYALGWILAAMVLIVRGDSFAHEIVPFLFPVILFLMGLMLAPTHTLFMTLICVVLVIIAPLVSVNDIEAVHPIFPVVAIGLMILSTLLSAQVTGELYQITEWALMNYQRERRTNDELFEKREQLHRSLKRSEALSNKLQEINQELEVAHAQAEEAKHFRGQFLANMSHELRTPLNAIIGFSETMIKFPMMYNNEALPTAYEGDVNQIYSSGRQLLHVINDILDLAKVDAGKLEIHMQSVDAGPIINAVASTAKGLIGARPIVLKKNLPDTLPTVWADESRLRQVLLNIYSNAVKYTDKGEIELTVHVVGDELHFHLRDTGIGIPEQDQDSIFEEFTQSESSGRDPRSGAGLGLAISRQLLTLMGGRIWMESVVGKGSTFSFAIPVYTAQDKKADEPTPESDDLPDVSVVTETTAVSDTSLGEASRQPDITAQSTESSEG